MWLAWLGFVAYVLAFGAIFVVGAKMLRPPSIHSHRSCVARVVVVSSCCSLITRTR